MSLSQPQVATSLVEFTAIATDVTTHALRKRFKNGFRRVIVKGASFTLSQEVESDFPPPWRLEPGRFYHVGVTRIESVTPGIGFSTNAKDLAGVVFLAEDLPGEQLTDGGFQYRARCKPVPEKQLTRTRPGRAAAVLPVVWTQSLALYEQGVTTDRDPALEIGAWYGVTVRPVVG